MVSALEPVAGAADAADAASVQSGCLAVVDGHVKDGVAGDEGGEVEADSWLRSIPAEDELAGASADADVMM